MPKKFLKKFDTYSDMTNDTFEVFYYKNMTFKEEQPHGHDFYELYYFSKGNITYIVEGNHYFLLPGDIILLSPGETHQALLMRENPSYEHIVVRIASGFMEQLRIQELNLANCFHSASSTHTNLLRMPAPQRQRVENTLRDLMAESYFVSTEALLAKTCLLSYALVGINLMYSLDQNIFQTARSSGLVISDISNYINEHYNEPLTLDDLTSRFFISKSHLLREFKHIYNTSVHQYIIHKRISVARDMMTDGISPTEVYLQCGFRDYSNFFRVFKSEYDMSPIEYFNKAQNRDTASD